MGSGLLIYLPRYFCPLGTIGVLCLGSATYCIVSNDVISLILCHHVLVQELMSSKLIADK